MAKNNLIMNNEWSKIFNGLSDEKAGQLVKAIFAINDGEKYEIGDPVLSAVMDMIGAVVIERKEKYEQTCRRNAENGKKGGDAKAANSKRNVATASECKRNVANINKINKKENNNIKGFEKPSVEEVRAYCIERGNTVDPEAFVAFYDSKGWKVGNAPMKSWKAAVVTWEKRSKPVNRFQNFQKRTDQEHADMVKRIMAMQ